ncbi:MAG: hypothetical protein HKN79_11255 [Flavobacteriales bacterium]|nr:hypothetical protein [Flavobacteriales bacterium]
MSTREYSSLSYEEKRELLRMNGSFVAEHTNSKKGKRTIYALYGFFVELNYDLSNQERYIRVYDNYFKTDTQVEGIRISLN